MRRLENSNNHVGRELPGIDFRAAHERGGGRMMPLVMADPGEENIIMRVGGSPDMKKHLEDMGFTVGSAVTVMNTISGNLIVKIRESRVAISKEMAGKIMV